MTNPDQASPPASAPPFAPASAPAAPALVRHSPRLRLARLGELLVLFGLGPALLARAPAGLVIPGILGGAALCLALLLRDPSFDRRQLWSAAAARRGLRPVLLRAIPGCLALLLLVVFFLPDSLFALPRSRPLLWLAIMLGYPLLSVYPQEIIFRTFFFHRYAGLLVRPAGLLLASAAAFGYAHVVLHNLPSVLISAVGGLLFASSYLLSRSTLLAAVEHALYGCFVFSVGLGPLFYAGGRTLSSTLHL